MHIELELLQLTTWENLQVAAILLVSHDESACKIFIIWKYSIGNVFSHSLSFDMCNIATIACFSTINDSGNCTIQYSELLDDLDSSSSSIAPFNSSFQQLPLMKSSTFYYLKIIFTLGSVSATLNTNFTASGNKFSA